MSRRRRQVAWTVFILLALVHLGASAAWASPFGPARGAGDLGFVSRLWETLTAFWAPAGCMMDPHGSCGPAPAPTLDEGCMIDPHGGCAAGQSEAIAPPPTMDAGCMIDPHGGCEPGS